MDCSTWVITIVNVLLAAVAVGAILHAQYWHKRNEEMRMIPLLYPDPKHGSLEYRKGSRAGWLERFDFRVFNSGYGPSTSYTIKASQGGYYFLGTIGGPSGKPQESVSCGALPFGEFHHLYFEVKKDTPDQAKEPEPIIVQINSTSVLGNDVVIKYEMRFYGGTPKSHSQHTRLMDPAINEPLQIDGKKRRIPKGFKPRK